MTPNRFDTDETGTAVQKLLIKKNGGNRTLADAFDLLIAMDHDARHRDGLVLSKLEQHIDRQMHMTQSEFDRFMAVRNNILDELRADVAEIEANCTRVHDRAPRRASDDAGKDWGKSVFGGKEDEETGDIKRAWRLGKWFVAAAVLMSLDIFARYLSHVLLGYQN